MYLNSLLIADMLSVQPDLTQTVVTVQHANSGDSPNNNHVNTMEKPPAYSVPDNNLQHRHSATLGKSSKTLLVEPTINHNVNNSMEKLTIKDKSNLSVPSMGSGRPMSQCESLQDSRQSMISMQLPSTIDAEAVTWSTFTSNGGRLLLPESGKGNYPLNNILESSFSTPVAELHFWLENFSKC